MNNHFVHDQSGPKDKWEPRKEPYKSWIESQGKNKILIVSGQLRQSLAPIKVGKSWKADSKGIFWFSTSKYSGEHNYGTNTMPQREFMYLSKDGMKDVVTITLKFLAEEK